MEWLTNLRNIALTVTALVAASGAIFGTHSYLDGRYALAAEHEKLEKRVTLSELEDLLRSSLENLHFYRDQSRKYPTDEDIKAKLKEAEEEVKDLKEAIKKEKEAVKK